MSAGGRHSQACKALEATCVEPSQCYAALSVVAIFILPRRVGQNYQRAVFCTQAPRTGFLNYGDRSHASFTKEAQLQNVRIAISATWTGHVFRASGILRDAEGLGFRVCHIPEQHLVHSPRSKQWQLNHKSLKPESLNSTESPVCSPPLLSL